jgi:hypothetical protein
MAKAENSPRYIDMPVMGIQTNTPNSANKNTIPMV